MKRISFLLFLLWASCLSLLALTIPSGTIYFDNSKTHYSIVKFVFGEEKQSHCHIFTMTDEGNDQWSLTLDQSWSDQYRYTFASTSMSDGEVSMTFPDLKEYISHTLNELRTATTSASIIVDGTFVPETGDNWAQGHWVNGRITPQREESGTLPLLYINTMTREDPTSRETYLSATCWLDNMGIDSIPTIGNSENPVTLQIRGRGNWTWNGFNKKPYRIKFDEKQPLAGLRKAKHFCLLSHADDNLGYFRDEVGFELSRRLHLAWTPDSYPVELILNGSYRGLYFVTEPIRIGKHHVDIEEQRDLCTAPDSITGGWLLEIDNYSSDQTLTMTEGNGQTLRITYHSPEQLSSAQKNYLQTQLKLIDSTIYNSNKKSTAWEQLIDADALVRYYMVQELMEDTESFHGSCFFYKDSGEVALWTWGPVWDFGNAFQLMANRFLYDGSQFGVNWITEMSRWESFQQRIKSVWQEFLREGYPTLGNWIDDRASLVASAALCDVARWPEYGSTDMQKSAQTMKNRLEWRIAWLKGKWGEAESDLPDLTIENNNTPTEIYDLFGRKLDSRPQMSHGIYIINGRVVRY